MIPQLAEFSSPSIEYSLLSPMLIVFGVCGLAVGDVESVRAFGRTVSFNTPPPSRIQQMLSLPSWPRSR